MKVQCDVLLAVHRLSSKGSCAGVSLTLSVSQIAENVFSRSANSSLSPKYSIEFLSSLLLVLGKSPLEKSFPFRANLALFRNLRLKRMSTVRRLPSSRRLTRSMVVHGPPAPIFMPLHGPRSEQNREKSPFVKNNQDKMRQNPGLRFCRFEM